VRRGLAAVLAASVALPAAAAEPTEPPRAAEAAEAVRWFRATEQRLMDAIATGDKRAWDEVTDPGWVLTTEEGQLMGKKQFLDELRPLPAGLKGDISVQDLTVQHVGDAVAIVRFLADEWETVFGQRLSTRYRVTDAYRRDRESWKMVASHVSVVTQDPPAQEVSKDQWPGFVGSYRLLPDGWTLTVELRDGLLWGGRDPKKLRQFIPLAPSVFVLSGSLGEWMFVTDKGAVTHILNFRKFEPLVWTRVDGEGPNRPSSP
jgi:uncharacterized protein DUF4440